MRGKIEPYVRNLSLKNNEFTNILNSNYIPLQNTHTLISCDGTFTL